MPAAAMTLDELIYDAQIPLSLPDVYLRLREAIDSDSNSIDRVAEVVSLDPVLAALVLRMANSAFFGFSGGVDTISRAVGILGVQQIHDLVLAASVSESFRGISNELMDLDTFWYRSVHCAFLSREISRTAGFRGSDSIFVRGLLHDIGHLVLFNRYPEECRHAVGRSDQGLQARLAEEKCFIGIDAMQIAAQLARVWQLPELFVKTFEHLMGPEDADDDIAREIAMLHIAAQFSNGIDSDMLIEDIVERIRPSVWRIAQLKPEASVAALDESTSEMIDALHQVLGSGTEQG